MRSGSPRPSWRRWRTDKQSGRGLRADFRAECRKPPDIFGLCARAGLTPIQRGRRLPPPQHGFLEVNLTPLTEGRYRVEFQPWHNFQLNAGDAGYTVIGSELRVTGFDTIMPCAKLELEYLPESKRTAAAIVLTLGY